MKKYPSTEELREVFDYVDGCLYWKIKPSVKTKIGDKAGSQHKATGYMQISYKNNRYLLHRLIWIWHGNSIDTTKEIDHINRCRTDNRIENLRQVTRAVNRSNRAAQYVYKHTQSKKWRAYTTEKQKQVKKYIGYYETKEEALEAVKKYYEWGCAAQ